MRHSVWDVSWFEDPVWRKERIIGINLHMITAFLDRFVKGDESRAAYLDVPVPESSAGRWQAPAGHALRRASAPALPGITLWKGFQRDYAERSRTAAAPGAETPPSRRDSPRESDQLAGRRHRSRAAADRCTLRVSPSGRRCALIEAPQFVTRVHEAFVAAGAEVITTNSYAVVPFHLGQARFERDGHGTRGVIGAIGARGGRSPPRAPLPSPPACRPCAVPTSADRFDAAAARPILATLVRALEPSVDLLAGRNLKLAGRSRTGAGGAGRRTQALVAVLHAGGRQDGAVIGSRLRSGERVTEAVATAARLGAAAILFNCSARKSWERRSPKPCRCARTGVGADYGGDRRLCQRLRAAEPLIEANEGLSDLRSDVSPPAVPAMGA